MNSELRVMVVDDHPLQLAVLKNDLIKLGIKYVSTQGSVDSAVEYLAQDQVDIIICDLQMPGRDGVEMMIELNKNKFSGKVVLLSVADPSIISAVKSMCDSFCFEVIGEISKPYDEYQLESIFNIEMRQAHHKLAIHRDIAITEEEFLFALANNRVKNYYQPLVDFNSGKTVGVEALARWLHPIYGIIMPGTFIPIVEKCQLSNELFDTVIGNAMADIKSGNLPYHVSVNVDHINLVEPDFSEKFINACRDNDICPSQFTMEITERDYYVDSVELYKNVSKLRLNGVTISIDDFGTGHSSLQKLSSLPFNEIKIDRSFINGMTKEPKKRKIVSFICGLAKSMDINLVAEGVEDKSTWELLKGFEVDTCQGYYTSKPMPLEAFNVLG